jgi:hypothetical protein
LLTFDLIIYELDVLLLFLKKSHMALGRTEVTFLSLLLFLKTWCGDWTSPPTGQASALPPSYSPTFLFSFGIIHWKGLNRIVFTRLFKIKQQTSVICLNKQPLFARKAGGGTGKYSKMCPWLLLNTLSTGVWTQGLTLTRQALYYLNYNPNPFCSTYFLDRVSCFCLGWLQTMILPPVVSPTAFLLRRGSH